MRVALEQLFIEGVQTNIEYQHSYSSSRVYYKENMIQALLQNSCFSNGENNAEVIE